MAKDDNFYEKAKNTKNQTEINTDRAITKQKVG